LTPIRPNSCPVQPTKTRVFFLFSRGTRAKYFAKTINPAFAPALS